MCVCVWGGGGGGGMIITIKFILKNKKNNMGGSSGEGEACDCVTAQRREPFTP